ncbi:hypothetical protein GCM10010919_13960 [Alishewanella longhuensis]|uniref:DUF3955 domain-containing protein n=1 Tax=Alishewanella longhuensis TaxID=1091037 RepID=A0ABQ3L113_9ALTE|nr:hypothetical protein [Alishewanella longhuensis]GHG66346.1 hypothetical protein GCM10010919_13960 [Alishewanella longhuensis]
MNIKFLTAMLYSRVFLIFSGSFGLIWIAAISMNFLVSATSVKLNSANVTAPIYPLFFIIVLGTLLIGLSVKLASKAKSNE